MLLKNLSVPMKTLLGDVMLRTPKQPLTMGLALTDLVGKMDKAKCPGVETLKAYRLGQRLLDAKDELEFDDDEWGIVREAVRQNGSGFLLDAIAQCELLFVPAPDGQEGADGAEPAQDGQESAA